MTKKTEVDENVSRETLTNDGWVLVRANERLAGGPDGVIEVGEEYLQPPEAAAFMVAQGWVSYVGAPSSAPTIEDSDE